MIEEKLISINNIIEEELNEYELLSALSDEKKDVLVKSNLEELEKVDNRIKEKTFKLTRLEAERKELSKSLGLETTNLSTYIQLAHENSLQVEFNLLEKQQRFQKMNEVILHKETVNKELLEQGIMTIGKLIKIIVNGATLTNQYNNYGKNTKDRCMSTSSISEEV